MADKKIVVYALHISKDLGKNDRTSAESGGYRVLDDISLKLYEGESTGIIR
jgi:hypothetical protein